MTLVAILGMHRSGTSAVAGMLADHGIEFGPVRTRNRFNPRGNRELPPLNELHEALIARSGGSWWDPPVSVEVGAEDLRRRDAILATIQGDPAGVKDPRMLVCPDLWRDLDLNRIGVPSRWDARWPAGPPSGRVAIRNYRRANGRTSGGSTTAR